VRLPRRALSRRARGLEVLQGSVATLLLLAVVAGVPLALVTLVGNPLPTTLPGRAWLDAELTASAVLDVLTVVLWGVWLHFVVCVVAEFRAWSRGGPRGRVPLGTGNQLLARRLVAAVLLLAAGAVWVPGTATAVGAVLHAAPVSASTATAGAAGGGEAGGARAAATTEERAGNADAAAPGAAAPGAGAPGAGAPGAGAPDAGWQAAGAPLVAYLVEPPQGRHHDCLWDIAERTLGDPLRYPEIFALNRDRVQPDGSRLVDADLIRPGWTLLLPADAVGGQQVLTAPAAPGPSTPVPAPATPAATTPTAPDAPADEDGLVQRSVLSGGLLAVGLLTATRRWQGPAAEPAGRGLDDPDRALFLDAALRQLAAAVQRAGGRAPEVVAARLGVDELHLHLAADTAAGPPPAPWRAASPTLWSLARRDLDGAAPGPAGTPAPYPALADVARAGDDDLLVDLEAAPGLVALAGDAAVAKALALSVAAELALNPWSDGVDVHLVGFAAPHADLAPGHLHDAATLDGVLAGLEEQAAAHDRLARALGVEGTVSGRGARAPQRPRPRVVVLSGPPGAADAQRLDRLVAAGRTPFAVVVVGDVATARWRFTCTPDGDVDLGPLGVRGVARQLDEAGHRELTAMSRAFG